MPGARNHSWLPQLPAAKQSFSKKPTSEMFERRCAQWFPAIRTMTKKSRKHQNCQMGCQDSQMVASMPLESIRFQQHQYSLVDLDLAGSADGISWSNWKCCRLKKRANFFLCLAHSFSTGQSEFIDPFAAPFYLTASSFKSLISSNFVFSLFWKQIYDNFIVASTSMLYFHHWF